MVRRCHKVNRSILIKLVDWICDGYADALVTGIEENEHYFPYTIALVHFIDELQRKCIKANYDELVNDSIIDNVLKEPKVKEGIIGWRNTADNKIYQVGEQVEVIYGMHFIAQYE